MFDFLFGKKSANVAAVENPVEKLDAIQQSKPAPVIERYDFVDDTYVEDRKYSQPVSEGSFSQTGKPIDRIYGFVATDYEQDGYNDAIQNHGKEYRDQKVKMIRNEFQNLFQSVRLEYNDRIRQLDDEIINAEELFVMSSARRLKSLKSTLEEHLSLLSDLEQKLTEDDPRMTLMIQTYERGFAKGVMVSSEKFV